MKPLQNYIEEEKKRLVSKFIKKVSDWREGGGHTCDYIKCQTVEEFEQEIDQSLHRIAKITAREMTPQKLKPIDADYPGYASAIRHINSKKDQFLKGIHFAG